jgi:hypothetical protein
MSDMRPEQVTEIIFNPEKARRGIYEEPRPMLDSSAPVIVVHRNEFLVSQWKDDGFIHPANQRELAGAAEEVVRSNYPFESFDSNEMRIFSCPAELASKFDWDWPKK